MNQITLRVTNETMAFVRRTASQRKTAESGVWRELIELGVHRSDEVVSQLKRNARLIVQALTMSQRVAIHLDPELVQMARDDARLLIKRMESLPDSHSED